MLSGGQGDAVHPDKLPAPVLDGGVGDVPGELMQQRLRPGSATGAALGPRLRRLASLRPPTAPPRSAPACGGWLRPGSAVAAPGPAPAARRRGHPSRLFGRVAASKLQRYSGAFAIAAPDGGAGCAPPPRAWLRSGAWLSVAAWGPPGFGAGAPPPWPLASPLGGRPRSACRGPVGAGTHRGRGVSLPRPRLIAPASISGTHSRKKTQDVV